jgi:hypothetical protein
MVLAAYAQYEQACGRAAPAEDDELEQVIAALCGGNLFLRRAFEVMAPRVLPWMPMDAVMAQVLSFRLDDTGIGIHTIPPKGTGRPMALRPLEEDEKYHPHHGPKPTEYRPHHGPAPTGYHAGGRTVPLAKPGLPFWLPPVKPIKPLAGPGVPHGKQA